MSINDVTGKSTDTPITVEKVVTKRSGETQPMCIIKIRARLTNLLEGLASKHIGLDLIITKVVSYA